MPLVEQFLGEGVAVGVTLGIEAGPGVAVAVPGAAHVIVAFKHDGIDSQVGESLDLIDAGHACTDDYDFMPLCFHNQTLPGYVTVR